MKKIVIVLLMLGSLSVFAETLTATFTCHYEGEKPGPSLIYAKPNLNTPKRYGNKLFVFPTWENAHAFCISKGYERAIKRGSEMWAADVAKKIAPNGETIGEIIGIPGTPATLAKVLTFVECERAI